MHLKVMKHIFLSSLIILNLSLSAQPIISKSDSIKLLQRADSIVNRLGWGCGKAPRPTPAVKFMEDIAINSKAELPLLIHSQNPSIKYLAVILCEHYEKKGLIKLDQTKKSLIVNASSSNEIVKTCSGCTIREEKTLGWLLHERKDWDLKFWLRRIDQSKKE
ncbi:MAG: hypothetical protein ACJ75J_14300 [Cytophagaceae bacterium]